MTAAEIARYKNERWAVAADERCVRNYLRAMRTMFAMLSPIDRQRLILALSHGRDHSIN